MNTEARQSQSSKANQCRRLRLDILPSVPRTVLTVIAASFISLPHVLRIPGNSLKHILPLVFATIRRGDLLVGGVSSVTTDMASARTLAGTATIFLWSMIVVLIAVGLGASAGPVVARIHATAAFDVTLARADWGGVALSALRCPADGFRRVTTRGGDMGSDT